MTGHEQDPKSLVTAELERYVGTDEQGGPDGKARYFDAPLVGFASALDPLFDEYKRVIGDFHLTPRELFEAEYGPGSFKNGTVVCWVLPIVAETVAESRKEKALPTRRWAHTRWFGEKFNETLRSRMAAFLNAMGYRSVAPILTKDFKWVTSPSIGLASTWSERHAAYAAGLGTFSLNDGLITARGIAHRCGSILTELVVEPDSRPYKGVYDYCLSKGSGKKCGVCMKRCPGNAISEQGHDKAACSGYSRTHIFPTVNKEYGVEISGCGLCQTAVPCEKAIPVKGV